MCGWTYHDHNWVYGPGARNSAGLARSSPVHADVDGAARALHAGVDAPRVDWFFVRFGRSSAPGVMPVGGT